MWARRVGWNAGDGARKGSNTGEKMAMVMVNEIGAVELVGGSVAFGVTTSSIGDRQSMTRLSFSENTSTHFTFTTPLFISLCERHLSLHVLVEQSPSHCSLRQPIGSHVSGVNLKQQM